MHFISRIPKSHFCLTIIVIFYTAIISTFAPFRAGLCYSPYPTHYRVAFAFSAFLCPHLCRLPLRVAFPFGRGTRFPCFTQVTELVRFALFADGVWCPRGRQSRTPFPPQYLLVYAYQHL